VGEEREERFARNQALFREVNERIESLAEPDTATDELALFTCECANLACTKRIQASLDEYELVRSQPTWFLVAPGHLDLEVEEVIAEREQFWIVEKRRAAGEAARALDPRT
jgi:hypothetical protein